ncbi:MAG TPA: hypothetical protein VKA63_06900 [Candidatus Krumholzibacteria bacterium]|nr:hypothetical protein [Candidatus Krumholzibacteria bacterium]
MHRQERFRGSALGSSGPGFALLALCAFCFLSLAACRDRGEGAGSANAGAGHSGFKNATAGAVADLSPEHSAKNSSHIHLDFDFGARQLLVFRHELQGAGTASDSLTVLLAGGEEADLEEFRLLLARQAGIGPPLQVFEAQRLDFLSHDLGRRLLGPVEALLEDSPRWVVSPLSAAPLEALVLPWGDGDTLLLQRVVVSYTARAADGSKSTTQCPLAANSRQSAGHSAGHGILALIPYTPDLTPLQDDPDTLLWTLRSQLRRLDTIPRAETSPGELETVLAAATGSEGYALVLLRARPAEAEPLLSSLSGTNSLVWWVRPPHEERSNGYLGEARTRARCLKQARRLVRGGYGVVVDLWPRDDQSVKRGVKVWIAALQSEEPVALALTEAKRAIARRDPDRPGLWAGWIALGPCDTPLKLSRPGLLQRIFSSGH